MKYFVATRVPKSNIIVNIPHSSIKIPTKFTKSYLLSKKELKYELFSMSDLYTDALFGSFAKKHNSFTMKVSRILVDVERFADDKIEPMSKVGMSALYTLSQFGSRLRILSNSDSTYLRNNIYEKFHKSLNTETERILKSSKNVVIFDCHSFPDNPRNYEPDKASPRPDICIGTDDFHTPPLLTNILIKKFSDSGFSVKTNSPFSGCLVPDKYYKKNSSVTSVMIEVNRRLYMNETTFNKKKDFNSFKKKLISILDQSLNEYERIS